MAAKNQLTTKEPKRRGKKKPAGEAVQIRVSVRNLVEFLLRNGNIDNSGGGRAVEGAMQAGSKIHKEIQKQAGSDYEAEVPMSIIVPFQDFVVSVEGRADGVIHKKNGVTIDEIKGTYRNLEKIAKPKKEHLAQAMCYAYMVLVKEELSEISVQVTYCNLETEATRRFKETLTAEEITHWFTNLMSEYAKWAQMEVDWGRIRNESIHNMTFPMTYRKGQEELIGKCREAFEEEHFLFLEAPTGCGKTITTLYPAIEQMKDGKIRRVFYLTAKTITRTVAGDTLNILRRNALRIKSIVLTAKEKICILNEPDCNPRACERANGHYDRINDALYDCLTSEEELTREKIMAYARKHNVCPFEFSLDLSLFADVIICDYNYIYDPHIYLRRFFAESELEPYLFLTDEAHNLVDRAREMYSAELCKEKMQALAEYIEEECFVKAHAAISKHHAARIKDAVLQMAASLLQVKRKCDESNKYVYEDWDEFAPQLQAMARFTSVMRKYLEEEDGRGGKLRKAILDLYFEVSHFQDMWECKGEEYRLYGRITDEERFVVKLLCMNPGRLLTYCHKKAKAGVLFSATMFPMEYYRSLLGGTEEDTEVLAESIFPKENRLILTAKDTTSRFEDRTQENYEVIAGYIYRTVKAKQGNYMVFFPSFDFAQRVQKVLLDKYAPVVFDLLMQKEGMTEEERESFLAKFRKEPEKEEDAEGLQNMLLPVFSEKSGISKGRNVLAKLKRSVVGFCVLGGIFSEGIDLVGDELIGAMIVGGGIPYVTLDRDLMRAYFDEDGGRGYEYAYQIPGMNKVLQAAGRVIRTAEDRGIIIYLEKRFLRPEYEILFPKHMKADEAVNFERVGREIASFWS